MKIQKGNYTKYIIVEKKKKKKKKKGQETREENKQIKLHVVEKIIIISEDRIVPLLFQ